MKEYEFHEAANIFPLDEEHLDELAEDIRQNGQQFPIELMDGRILDGRRRYLACKKARIEPEFKKVEVADPVDYVLSLNLHRRHLTPSQRAMCAGVAAELKKKYAEQARERQKGGRGGKLLEEKLPQASGREPQTRDKIGKMFDVSGKTYDQGVKVATLGTPGLQEAVKTGLIAVSTAAKYAPLPPEEQNAFVARQVQARAEGKKPRSRPAASRQNGQDFEFNGELKGVGTIRAREAIDRLRSIPKNDALRKEGLEKVEDWIRHNK